MKWIPVILISATIQSLAERINACGAAGGFSKPFDPKDRVAMIVKYIR